MNSRDPFPDEELRHRIMDFIMAAGQTLLENGAEVFRVEQTMEIMARSFHLREFHVYVLTNGIFASAGTAEIRLHVPWRLAFKWGKYRCAPPIWGGWRR